MRYIFLTLGFIFFLAWIAAFVVYHVASGALHLLLILALLFVVIHLFRAPGKTA